MDLQRRPRWRTLHPVCHRQFGHFRRRYHIFHHNRALSLASGQFGPRLLRNFVRDTGNQIVLGTFVATFLYCLLVIRTIRSAESHLCHTWR